MTKKVKWWSDKMACWHNVDGRAVIYEIEASWSNSKLITVESWQCSCWWNDKLQKSEVDEMVNGKTAVGKMQSRQNGKFSKWQ